LTNNELSLYDFLENSLAIYNVLLGPYVDGAILNLPKDVRSGPPFSFIFDSDNTDLFAKKRYRQMYLVLATTLYVFLMFVSLFRRFCCTKKVYVVVAKNGRRKRMED
jgi:hypothetical protein